MRKRGDMTEAERVAFDVESTLNELEASRRRFRSRESLEGAVIVPVDMEDDPFAGEGTDFTSEELSAIGREKLGLWG